MVFNWKISENFLILSSPKPTLSRRSPSKYMLLPVSFFWAENSIQPNWLSFVGNCWKTSAWKSQFALELTCVMAGFFLCFRIYAIVSGVPGMVRGAIAMEVESLQWCVVPLQWKWRSWNRALCRIDCHHCVIFFTCICWSTAICDICIGR